MTNDLYDHDKVSDAIDAMHDAFNELGINLLERLKVCESYSLAVRKMIEANAQEVASTQEKL